MHSYLRSNKYLLFGGLGAAGGAVAGSFPSMFTDWVEAALQLRTVTGTCLWMGVCSLFIAWGLFLANEIYHRRSPWRKETILRATLSGLIGGGIAGAVAQNLFDMQKGHSVFKEFFLRSFCWGVAGMLLGLALTQAMPNLGLKRTALAGLAGGTVGGFGFIVTAHAAGSDAAGQVVGRMVGLGILGLALGLAVVLVETLLREASLRIIWAPKEETSVTLGPHTITIGGGDDTVYVAGLPQHAAGIQFKEGQITYTDLRSQQKTVLRNGTKLQIGKVEVIVQAQA